MILSAKYSEERPYIANGPLIGKYVFSQLHFHWGCNNMEGSEHTIDGSALPGEMHVVTFKSCYLTQESALKEKDGVAVISYFFKVNFGLQFTENSLSIFVTQIYNKFSYHIQKLLQSSKNF